MTITDIIALINIAHKAFSLIKLNDVDKSILKRKLEAFLDDLK